MTHPTMLRVLKATGKKPAEIAKDLGIEPQNINNWSKRGISKEGIKNISKLYNIGIDWILNGGDYQQSIDDILQNTSQSVVSTEIDNKTKLWLPLMDISFSCGNGVGIEYHFEETKKRLAFEPDFLSNRGVKASNTRLLYARGDSMEEFIFDGDIFAIDISDTNVRDGQIYAVYFEGEAMLKQIFKEAAGTLILHSKNPKYRDKIVTEDNGADFKVLGRQFWRAG